VTNRKNTSGFSSIREQAEAVIHQRTIDDPGKLASLSETDVRKLVHELSVHQIELEIQNEELRRATEMLERAHLAYFNLYDLAPVGFLTIDENGRILKGNLFLSKMLGVERKKIIGEPITAFIFSEDQDLYYHFRKQTFVTNGPQRSCELRLMTSKGATSWANLSASCGDIVDGTWEASIVLTDIRQQKKAEESLILNSKLASLGLLSMGIAHEINNPLTIIAGTLQLIESDSVDSSRLKEGHKTIQTALLRMKRIVEGLQKFSRSSGHKVRTRSELSKLVGDTVQLMKGSIAQASIELTYDLEAGAYISCDEVEIEQVIFNIIGNAIGAIKSLDEKWIKIDVLSENETVVLRVTDSGPGIPEEIRARLFDPFFTTKDVGQGTGLGLSISKGILDDHGATIAVRSDLPNTCFEIRFKSSRA